MGVRQFFWTFFPASTRESFLEEVFALFYSLPGMDWEGILDMDREERGIMLRRLFKQLKDEAAAIKAAKTKKK